MKVKLIEILDAMNYTGIGAQFLYHIGTEEIVMRSDKVFGLTRNEKLEKDVRKNPDDYIDLPNEYEIDEIGMMDTYIENFPESELKEELRDTLVGRSPHQKFEEKLKAIELWDDWVQYRAGEYDWIARKWAADNGLTIVE